MKAALIIDGGRLAQWQRDALEACGDALTVTLVLNCTNTRTRKRPFRHFLYYVINVLMMSGDWRKSVPLPSALNGVERVDFESEYDGAWQRIPDAVVARIAKSGADVVLKFGMNLLARPEKIPAKHGVLSYHHGDPEYYRGRPAGFYELLDLAPYQGVIVQRLAAKLDGGAVVAQVRSKVYPHSYSQTLAAAYRNSIPLLRRAVANLEHGRVAPNHAAGRAYTLPGNWTAFKFLARLAWRTVNRTLYGAFWEKRWNVATVATDAAMLVANPVPPPLRRERVHAIDRRYVFYADPFPLPDGRLLVEALERGSGRGVLVILDGDAAVQLTMPGVDRHYSYPQVVQTDGALYVLPENAEAAPPSLFRLDLVATSVVDLAGLIGFETQRAVDPTYHYSDGVHYLFCGHLGSEIDCLNLYWSTESVRGPYHPHPCNPVVIDPSRARMGGNLLEHDGVWYRPGQDNAFGYGAGLTLCEVTTLSPSAYEERPVSRLSVAGASGPHTLNRVDGGVVFDFYEDRFSLLAGVRRLRARL